MTLSLPTSELDIVIFGGAGDLSFRKLLPALYMAHLHERLPASARIIAVGRQPWSREQYLDFIGARSPQFIEAPSFDAVSWDGFVQRLHYVSLDVTDAAAYAALQALGLSAVQRVFYLATAPGLFTGICAHLDAAGLLDAHSRVVLEKPLGTDLASAQAINTEVARHFREEQIYRIDHYLGSTSRSMSLAIAMRSMSRRGCCSTTAPPG